MNPKL